MCVYNKVKKQILVFTHLTLKKQSENKCETLMNFFFEQLITIGYKKNPFYRKINILIFTPI